MKRVELTLIAVTLIVTLSLRCAAQAQVGSLDDLESQASKFRQWVLMVEQSPPRPEVNSEDIMDAAFDVKKAAQRADELQADGAKYCGWSKARVDASDLDVAISRHLLNHGTLVPDHILASKMWHVSFIAADLIDQLDLGGAQCALLLRLSSEAHRLFGEYASGANNLRIDILKFDQLAARQTLWQEEANVGSLRKRQQNDPETLKLQLRSVLVAAREVKEAAEAADKAIQESRKVPECTPGDLPRADLKALAALIDDIEHGPDDYLLLASNMRTAKVEGDITEATVIAVLQSCSLYAGEKKAARNMVHEAIGAHHRLRKAIVGFEPLVVRQAEWEEQTVQEQIVPQEQ